MGNLVDYAKNELKRIGMIDYERISKVHFQLHPCIF